MILVGVGLEVLATVAGTIGKQLLRYSKLIESTDKAACSCAFLAIGLILNVLGGPVLEVAAYGQAPQTLLAPLSGLDVLWNILLVPHTLGERPSATQMNGCFMLVVGTALTVVGGPHTELQYTSAVVRDRLVTTSALIYIVVELFLIGLGAFYVRRRPAGDQRRGLVLGCVAGGIGGNLFCMKAAASLISAYWDKGLLGLLDVWTAGPMPIIVAFTAGLIGLSSACLLTMAMREFEATMMVATYEGAFVISGCASGVAVLGELDSLPPSRVLLYTIGVFVVIGGVLAAQQCETSRAPTSTSTTGATTTSLTSSPATTVAAAHPTASRKLNPPPPVASARGMGGRTSSPKQLSTPLLKTMATEP